MNRTQGNPDYVLVKPWLQLPSNCVVPVGVAESWATANSIIGQYWTMCGGVRGYINQRGLSTIDPATNAPYDVTRYDGTNGTVNLHGGAEIGRASCRERDCMSGWISGGAVALKKKDKLYSSVSPILDRNQSTSIKI